MRFIQGKYPVDQNSTDAMDSARLVGMMAVFKYGNYQHIGDYFVEDTIVRCPVKMHDGCYADNKNNITRDQEICLRAGLFLSGILLHEPRKFEDRLFCKGFEKDKPGGKKKIPDIFMPSHKNHFRLCAHKAPNRIGYLWLWQDVLYACKVDPWHEPNQLICMMMIAGPEYIRYWKANHPDWRKCIMQYWFDERLGKYNRGEKHFAEHIISVLEKI